MVLSPSSHSSSTGSKIEGFLSYAHKGDELLEFVEPLHHGLVNMIKLRANREIEIFRDRTSIKWGSRWESTIANGLEGASVLFVVATTHYLDSDACRDEFTTFLNTAKATGKTQATRLILPIMPVDASGVFNKKSSDPIAREIAQIQYELIEDAVMDGPGTAAWRRGMQQLTVRFIEVVDAAEKALTEPDDVATTHDHQGYPRNTEVVTDSDSSRFESPPLLAPEKPDSAVPFEDEEDSLDVEGDDRGITELAAHIESNLTDVTGLAIGMSTALSAMSEEVGSVDLTNVNTAGEMNARFQKIARIMKPFSLDLGGKGSALREKVTDIDVTLRRLVSLQTKHDDPTNMDALRSQLKAIEDGLASVAHTEVQMNSLLDSMVGAEVASSAVRKALRPMRTGITAFGDAIRIMQEWGPGLLRDA